MLVSISQVLGLPSVPIKMWSFVGSFAEHSAIVGGIGGDGREPGLITSGQVICARIPGLRFGLDVPSIFVFLIIFWGDLDMLDYILNIGH